MGNYDTVLVGIDGSEVAGVALTFAADEAHRRGARLVVAHAGWAGPKNPEPGVRPHAEIVCREAITRVTELHPDLETQVVQRNDDPAALLVELSATADLLVVGTHRTGRLRGWVLGSVSQYVAAHSVCPVVTITTAADRDTAPIVLGASASPGGVAALRFACHEARLRGVPVHAVRSITTEDWALTSPGYTVMIGADVMHDAARAELDKLLTLAKEEYPDVSITGEVTSANPYLDLLKAADGAALLVIGSRRNQKAVLPHLGPVAAWLLHQSTCPLAVVGYGEE